MTQIRTLIAEAPRHSRLRTALRGPNPINRRKVEAVPNPQFQPHERRHNIL